LVAEEPPPAPVLMQRLLVTQVLVFEALMFLEQALPLEAPQLVWEGRQPLTPVEDCVAYPPSS